MRVGVVGINQKLAGVGLRERLAQACQVRFSRRSPYIVLSTCNRTEVYFWGGDLAHMQSTILSSLQREFTVPVDHLLYSYFGPNCFLHLARVTAGLDSAVLGETEIQGQVKGVYEGARIARSLPSCIHYLFQKSLGIAKRVRAQGELKGHVVTLESEVARIARCLLGGWKGKRILVVGASSVGRRVLARLHGVESLKVTLCNRTQEHARLMAERFGIDLLCWRDLKRWSEYDAVIVGTKAPEPLLWAHQWRPKGMTPVLIDLSVPRNVDPALARFCPLVNIDALGAQVASRRRLHRTDIDTAVGSVMQAVRHHMALWERKQKRPMPIQEIA